MLLDGNTEHLRCRCAVDVLAVGKDLLPPCFSGKPRNDTGFDCRKVRNNEFAVALRNKRCADKLGQRIRHIFVEHFYSIVIAAADKSTGFGKVGKVVLRQVLHLNDASCPPTCAVGTVKLEHTSGTTIGAHGGLHRLILFHRGFGKLLPKGQHRLQLLRCGFQHFRHSLFAKGVGLHAVVRKPLFHLLHGVWIVQRGQFLHRLRQLGAGSAVHLNRLPYKLHIQRNTTVVDFLVDVIFVPYAVRHRIFGKPSLYGHFGLHIADVIFLERQPLIRSVCRKVACALFV